MPDRQDLRVYVDITVDWTEVRIESWSVRTVLGEVAESHHGNAAFVNAAVRSKVQ